MWVFNIKNLSPIFPLIFVCFWHFFNRLSGKLGNIVHKLTPRCLCSIFFRYDLLYLNLYGNMVTMGMESRLQNCPMRALK